MRTLPHTEASKLSDRKTENLAFKIVTRLMAAVFIIIIGGTVWWFRYNFVSFKKTSQNHVIHRMFQQRELFYQLLHPSLLLNAIRTRSVPLTDPMELTNMSTVPNISTALPETSSVMLGNGADKISLSAANEIEGFESSLEELSGSADTFLSGPKVSRASIQASIPKNDMHGSTATRTNCESDNENKTYVKFCRVLLAVREKHYVFADSRAKHSDTVTRSRSAFGGLRAAPEKSKKFQSE